MPSRRAQRGMTLIEIMVVIFIAALIVGGVAFSIGATDQVKLRSSCWTLAAAVRFAYSHAVTQGMTTRLVMDFESGSFHLEETRGPVVLNREDETGEGLRREGDEQYLDGGLPGASLLDAKMNSIGSSLGSAGGGTMGAGAGTGAGSLGVGLGMGLGSGGASGEGDMFSVMEGLAGGRVSDPFLASLQTGFTGNPAGYRRPKFSALDGRRGENRELEGNTKFVSVYTPHSPHPQEEGKAYIYFFPGGVTEHSIIQVSDGGERVYSIEVHPISGRAVIHTEAVEPEENLDDLQEAEE
jgi:general secretion pathway protein H